jgi:hydroxypyruvate reductase
VTVTGTGRGGRNTEFLLALALALRGAPGIFALAADTDGIDGSEDNAGAFYLPAMIDRQDALVFARECLARNDAYSWFAACDGLVVTGPTCTNVNDFRALLVLPLS